jgi:hypothetical protein
MKKKVRYRAEWNWWGWWDICSEHSTEKLARASARRLRKEANEDIDARTVLIRVVRVEVLP